MAVTLSATLPQFVDFASSVVVTNARRAVHKRLKYSKDQWLTVFFKDNYTCFAYLPYIIESNPHPFYSFRGLKNQMRIRFAVESCILEKW